MDGFFIRHYPTNRLPLVGCTLFILAPALLLSAYWILIGHPVLGWCVAGVLTILWFMTAVAPQPYGITVRPESLVFEQRNMFLIPKKVELTRDQWIDFWLERNDENFGTLYLNCLCGNAQDGLLTVPLLWGPWNDVSPDADRLSALVGMTWKPAILPPDELPVRAMITRVRAVMSSLRRVEGAEGQSPETIRQTLALRRMLIARFRAKIDPPAWIIDGAEKKLAFFRTAADRAEYSFADVAEVQTGAEADGFKTGSDDSPRYRYCYHVWLALRSGKRFKIFRYESFESSQTEVSAAKTRAQWSAGYLREILGLPAQQTGHGQAVGTSGLPAKREER
jgi:hypothetical protein